MYLNYNDYELLYLISDGNYKAYDLIIEKYKVLIEVMSKRASINENKIDDFIQEGLLLLIDCIKRYNSSIGVSFYSYFLICLKRKLGLFLSSSYYVNNDKFDEDNYLCENNSYNDDSLLKCISYDIKKEFDDISILLFNECLIGNQSLTDFAKDNNISTNIIYKKYAILKKRIKEYLEKEFDIYE